MSVIPTFCQCLLADRGPAPRKTTPDNTPYSVPRLGARNRHRYPRSRPLPHSLNARRPRRLLCRGLCVKRAGVCGARVSRKEKVLTSAYFPTHEYAVSSAMEGLTSEFGMGSGVPPPPWMPAQILVTVREGWLFCAATSAGTEKCNQTGWKGSVGKKTRRTGY